MDSARFHGARSPAYNRLDLRVDKKFYFSKSALSCYMDLWNILDRDNVAYYDWDEQARVLQARSHISFLPVIGVEYKF